MCTQIACKGLVTIQILIQWFWCLREHSSNKFTGDINAVGPLRSRDLKDQWRRAGGVKGELEESKSICLWKGSNCSIKQGSKLRHTYGRA